MNYDGAKGWLVGEPGRGLNAMFTMMNAERLLVGVQGLGVGEAANQKATLYARERRQGRGPDSAGGPVPIIAHPDVRKMLLTGRAYTDAGRALAVWAALQMDIAARHPDAALRRQADGLVALLTPVIKAAFTDFGFETAVLSQQVFGGHGYIREWGMEQYVRDARITQIYEGTNGVQAMDLVSRKLPMEDGAVAARLFGLIREEVRAAVPSARIIGEATLQGLERLERATMRLSSQRGDPAAEGVAATDYLRLFALVAYGWMWTRMAATAGATASDDPLCRRKIAVARFFAERLLPHTLGLEAALAHGPDAIVEFEPALL
jgi:hypothetical protein